MDLNKNFNKNVIEEVEKMKCENCNFHPKFNFTSIDKFTVSLCCEEFHHDVMEKCQCLVTDHIQEEIVSSMQNSIQQLGRNIKKSFSDL